MNKELVIFENQLCPICSMKKSNVSEYEVEDPYFGEVCITTINCLNCGFKSNDFEFLNPKKPCIYELKVSSKKDLDIRIAKSGDSEVKILELGIEKESFVSSEGLITNVEGLIRRFKDKINLILNDKSLEGNKKEKAKKLVEKINLVLEGKMEITLVLIDKSGNSSIISDKVKITKL